MSDDATANAAQWFDRVLRVPLIEFLGMTAVDPHDPGAGLRFNVAAPSLNAGGVLHGGVTATALDLAAYLAVLADGLEPAEQAVTHSFAASYLTAVTEGETVVARGDVLRRARRIVFVSSTLTAADRLVAVATVTKSIVSER